MKTKMHLIALFILFTLPLQAQEKNDLSYPSRFSLTESAEILPHLSFFGRIGAGVFTKDMTTIHGRLSIGIAGIIELAIENPDASVDFYGNPVTAPQWGFKFRLLEQSEHSPAVSFLFRTSFDWKGQAFFDPQLAVRKPIYHKFGLRLTSHRMRLSSGILIATQKLLPGFHVTGGFGVQEFQTKELLIIMEPSSFRSDEPKHDLMLVGLLNARFDVSEEITCFVEAQSVPTVAPNLSRLSLDIDRGYLTTAGVRVVPLFPLSVDLMVSHQRPFMRVSNTEFRISLGTIIIPN